jgi:hypothetical protein
MVLLLLQGCTDSQAQQQGTWILQQQQCLVRGGLLRKGCKYWGWMEQQPGQVWRVVQHLAAAQTLLLWQQQQVARRSSSKWHCMRCSSSRCSLGLGQQQHLVWMRSNSSS